MWTLWKIIQIINGASQSETNQIHSWFWQQLADSLKSAWSPQKEVNVWKKEKKLAKSTSEYRATGGAHQKKQRIESTGERLKKFHNENNDRNLENNEKLDKIIAISKENGSNLRRQLRKAMN